MNSLEIQQMVYNVAINKDFNAPYGVLTGAHTNRKGHKYLSVTFGRARTLDVTVEIYNRNFIVVKSSQHGYKIIKNVVDLQQYLSTI